MTAKKPAESKKLRIRTGILGALARWADDGRSTNDALFHVVLSGDEAVACDGRRIVRVPAAIAYQPATLDQAWVGDPTFYLSRELIEAAVAAQEAYSLYRDEDVDGLAEIDVWLAGDRIILSWDDTRLSEKHVAWKYPDLDAHMPKPAETPPPSIGFNPEYLAGIGAFIKTVDEQSDLGVKVAGWGGELDPMLFTSGGGIRFVVMPTRFA